MLLGSNEAKVSLALVFQRGVSFLIFLILSKCFIPSEYADFVIIFTLIFTINEIGNSGLLQGVTRHVAEKRKDILCVYKGLIFTTFVNTLLVQVVIGIVLFTLVNTDILSGKVLDNIYLIASYIFLTLMMSAFNSFFNGCGRYSNYLISFLLNGFLTLFFVLLTILLFDLSIQGILLSYIASMTIVIIYQSIVTRKQIDSHYSQETTRAIWGVGKWYFLWAILSVVESKFEIFYMSYLSLTDQLVYYDVAIKFVIFVQILITACVTVINPQVVSANTKEKTAILNKRINKLVLLLCSWNVICGILVPIFIWFYYAGVYNESIFCYLIVAVGVFFSILNFPLSAEIYKINKPQLFVVTGILGCTAKTLLAVILIPELGAIGAAINYSIVSLVVLIATKFLINFVKGRA